MTRRPWLVWMMLLLFGGLFFLMERTGGSQDPRVLLRFGADQRDLSLGGQPWRWVSAGLLHIGWAHLLLNSWALYALGTALERLYGPRSFWALFVVATAGGSIASALFFSAISAGASGGIFGFFGAYVVLYWKRRHAMPAEMRAKAQRELVTVFLLNGAIAFFVPNLNHAAHVGGLLTGALCAAFLRDAATEGRVQRILTWVAAVVGFGCALAAMANSTRGDEDTMIAWREPAGRFSVRVPAWGHYDLQKDELHAFVGREIALGVQSVPVTGDWRASERAAFLAEKGLQDPRFEDKGVWLIARGVIDGDEYEQWMRVEEGRVWRLMYRVSPGNYPELRALFLRFVESFTPKQGDSSVSD